MLFQRPNGEGVVIDTIPADCKPEGRTAGLDKSRLRLLRCKTWVEGLRMGHTQHEMAAAFNFDRKTVQRDLEWLVAEHGLPSGVSLN